MLVVMPLAFAAFNAASVSAAALSLRAGVGAGAEITIGKEKKTILVFKLSYLYGSTAKYFSRPAVENLQVTLFHKESKTPMLLVETGVRFIIFTKEI